jgi:hypothetical protein
MVANIGEADPPDFANADSIKRSLIDNLPFAFEASGSVTRTLLIWSTLAAIAAYGPGNRPA